MSLIEARSRKARAFRLRFSQSLASLRHLLSQASVRSTNGWTVLPTRGFVSSRRLARAFRRRNPENDIYADAIDNIETIGDPGREVLQAADYERKVALDLDGVERGSMPLLELGKALFQTCDARLELRLVDEALRIAVDQPTDAAPHRRYLLIETDDLVRHRGAIMR